MRLGSYKTEKVCKRASANSVEADHCTFNGGGRRGGMEDFKNQTSCSRLLAAPKGPTIWSLRGGGAFLVSRNFFQAPQRARNFLIQNTVHQLLLDYFFYENLACWNFFQEKITLNKLYV